MIAARSFRATAAHTPRCIFRQTIQRATGSQIASLTQGPGGATTSSRPLINIGPKVKSSFPESSREDENRRKVVMVPHARRRFVPGQTYSPNELNDKNVDHYLKKNSKTELVDVCDLERKNPLKEYKNVSFLSQFLTQMGYIRAKRETGLSRENQRRMTKAVKRAKAIGMLPFTYNLWNARSQGRR